MISEEAIRDIIATYSKHGWVLRRVLLSKSSVVRMTPGRFFGEVPVIEAAIDAAWFSRPPRSGGVAWELRYLGATSFALVENVDEASPNFEDVLDDVVERLITAISERKAA